MSRMPERGFREASAVERRDVADAEDPGLRHPVAVRGRSLADRLEPRALWRWVCEVRAALCDDAPGHDGCRDRKTAASVMRTQSTPRKERSVSTIGPAAVMATVCS